MKNELVYETLTNEEVQRRLSIELPKIKKTIEEFRKSQRLPKGWRDLEVTI